MKPTEEQERVLDEASSSVAPLKIEAYAGSGKTSTLVMVAERLSSSKPLYLAFNREIAAEARRRFGTSARAVTVHALARESLMRHERLRAKIARFESTGQGGFRGSDRLTSLHYQREIDALLPGGVPREAREAISLAVLSVVSAFCQSSASEPSVDLLDPEFHEEGLLAVARSERDLIAQVSIELWARIISTKNDNPLTFDHQVKIWQLYVAERDLRAHGLILFDEAQDASDVMLAAVGRSGVRAIYVGDPHQQIYRFRGSVNAFEKIKDAKTAYFRTSFRFGEEIAHVAERILARKGCLARIDTLARAVVEGSETSRRAKAFISRTNVSALERALSLWKGGWSVEILASLIKTPYPLLDYCHLATGETQLIKNKTIKAFDSIERAKRILKARQQHDLWSLADLASRHGSDIPPLFAALRYGQLVKGDRDETIVVATAHQSKGLEWGTVDLEADFDEFLSPDQRRLQTLKERFDAFHGRGATSDEAFDAARGRLEGDEWNLLYVAATRARDELRLPPEIETKVEAKA